MNKRRWLSLILAVAMAMALLTGCASNSGVKTAKLNPQNPVVLTLWHYYNGAQKTAFDEIVAEFNNTEGLSQGIVIEAHNSGGVNELANSVLSAARGEAGAGKMPDMFMVYADAAFILSEMNMLTNLDEYISAQELAEFVPSFISEGRVSSSHGLSIFPIGKSTEALMLNKTDWDAFLIGIAGNAAYRDVGQESLSTFEGIYRAAEAHYEWSGGKALFGIDSMANLIYVGSRQLGVEVQSLGEGGAPALNLDKAAFRRIFDIYYGGMVRGYFGEFGRFRSDDAKVGDLLAFVGSTASGKYFPLTVTTADGVMRDIDLKALPMPVFEGGEKFAVQQGAGLCVAKSSVEREYAASRFLLWFTQAERNTRFSIESGGYMPVRTEALSGDEMKSQIDALANSSDKADNNVALTLNVASGQMLEYTLYNAPSFNQSMLLRNEFDTLSTFAKDARAAVLAEIEGGAAEEAAVAKYHSDAVFEDWYAGLCARAEAITTVR